MANDKFQLVQWWNMSNCKVFQTDNEFNPNEATNQKERKENTEKPKKAK